MENTTSSQQINENYQEIYNVGREFAFEGLSEADFKATSEEELAIFREGFKEGLRLQPIDNEQTEQVGLRM